MKKIILAIVTTIALSVSIYAINTSINTETTCKCISCTDNCNETGNCSCTKCESSCK